MKEPTHLDGGKVRSSIIGSFLNTFLFIVIVVIQIVVIWYLGDMFFGGSNDNDLNKQQQGQHINGDPSTGQFIMMSEKDKQNTFNERRFEIEVLQPQEEMVEKFSKHPNLVFSKLTKYIQKEEKRYVIMQLPTDS